MNARRALVLLAPLLVTFAPRPLGAADDDAGWEQITDDEGIRVWQREVQGTSLVEFRGRGIVEAPIQDIVAVIHDAEREKEWMESCNGSFTIEYKSPLRVISYNRTASPAPFISDRDVVVESVYEVSNEKHAVHVGFHAVTHPKVPPYDGVVRMPKLSGYWHLEYLGPKKTKATYQIQADPGGSLPKWIVNWASKSIPFDTLRHLRTQVTKGGYDKQLAVLDVAIDWPALTGKPDPIGKPGVTGTSTKAAR